MGKPTEKLPTERMHEVIELTLAKVRRYKNLGYDGVSFRADMLMNPGGQRDDQYDGDTVENRTRLFHEVCSAMRKAFGKKFIIEAVLAWEQNNGYGGNAKMGGGGNQQKVILGRWLLTDPEILLLDEPTRGIDVGAKYEIYQLIIDLAKQGKTVIMVSSEMPELLGVCDRILVMSGYKLAGEVDAKTATQEEIMTLAAKYV